MLLICFDRNMDYLLIRSLRQEHRQVGHMYSKKVHQDGSQVECVKCAPLPSRDLQMEFCMQSEEAFWNNQV